MVELLIIALIEAFIFESGWWENMDYYFNRKFRLCHLPKIFTCQFCQTWWLCLFYITIMGKLTLMNILLCLITANLGVMILPIITYIKNVWEKIIEKLNEIL